MAAHQQVQDAQIATALARALASRYPGRLTIDQPWFVDPQNVSGNASPNNTGASALAPLDRFSTLFARWGTYAPLITQMAVNITLMSDGILDGSDPVLLSPTCADGGEFVLDGVLRVVATGTFGVVTPQNRATAQRYQATVAGALPADWWTAFVGMLVHDTTSDAWFWVLQDDGAKTATFTRPKTSSLTTAASALATISGGDAFIIYDLPAIDLVQFTPTIGNGSNATFTQLYPCQIQHVSTAVGPAFAISTALFGGGCTIVESRMIGREPRLASGGVIAANCYSGGPYLIASSGFYIALSGVVSANDEHCVIQGGTLLLDGDAYVDDHVFASNSQVIIGLACVYGRDGPPGLLRIPNGQSDGTPGAGASLLITPYFYGACALWGTALVEAVPGGDIVYSGPAVVAFQNTGGLGLDSGTGSSYDGAGTWRGGIAITAANLDATVGAGGFGGCAYGVLGSKIHQWV